MSIHDALRRLKAVSSGSFPRSTFVALFIGVVIAPLVALAVSGSNPNILEWHGLAWLLLAVTLLLFAGIGGGFLMFRHSAYVGRGLSISKVFRRIRRT
jgi:hypothetical protein